MASFASRTLEITVISGENLQIHKKPIKNSSFVTVKSDSQNPQTSKIVENGGSYPVWNEKLILDLPMNAEFVFVEVQSRDCGRKMKSVGSCKVPVRDFCGGYSPENQLQFLSYRLRDSKGERNGIVNIAVRVKVPQKQVIGMPMPGCRFNDGEIVTGIPVWNVGYPA